MTKTVVTERSGHIRTTILHFILIAVMAMFVYSNTFDVPFHLDDEPNIVENPVIKDLKFFIEPSKAKDLKEYNAFISRYIGYFSFALNYESHGLEVRGYHVVNLLIHIINGMLVYILVLFTFKTPKLEGSSLKGVATIIALITALLFVSHPIQTQAVTYIVQRLTSMATMFYLGAIALYVGCRLSERGGWRYLLYGISVVFAVLSLKTKEIAFTLPAAVVLYEFIFFNGIIKKRLIYFIPFLLALLIILLSIADLEKYSIELVNDIQDSTLKKDISRTNYLLTEAKGAVTYLRIIVLPIGQNLYYNNSLYHSFTDPHVYLSVLFLFILFGFGIFFLYRSRNTNKALRIVSFGIFWAFITLSVESIVVSIYPIAEHRVYLPSIGIFLSMVTASFIIIAGIRRQVLSRALVFAFSIVTLVLSCAAYSRNSVWRSDISLWEDVIRKSPRNANANFKLGEIYMSRGLSNRAIMQYQKAIVYKPDFTSAYYNLGNIFRAKGLINSAINQYESVVWLKPDHAEAHFELGTAYSSKQDTTKAIEHYRAATKYKPDLAEAHFNLAKAYYDLGRPASALIRYKKAVEANPDYIEARYNIGLIYCKIKEYRKGIEEFEKILSIDPEHKEAKEMLELCEKQ